MHNNMHENNTDNRRRVNQQGEGTDRDRGKNKIGA